MRYYFLVLIVCYNLFGYAQKTVSTTNKQWIQYYSTIKLGKGYLLKTDGGFRVQNGFQDKSQYIARTGLYHKLMYKMQVGAGVATLGGYKGDTLHDIEVRPYQGFIINDIYGKTKTQHRFRVEERFIKPVGGDFNTFYFRFRYRFLVTIPLLDLSTEDRTSGLFLGLADEIFIHAGKDAVHNMFQQNRLMISTTYQVSKSFSTRLNYTYEYGAKNSAASFKENNIVWLGIVHKINSLGNKNREK